MPVLTASTSAGSPGFRSFCLAMLDCIAEIHFCKIDSNAPPSGRVRVDRCCISSLYVASPCPFVPVRRRSGDKSASITTKERSIALLRIICSKNSFRCHIVHTQKRKAAPPSSTVDRSCKRRLPPVACLLRYDAIRFSGTTPAVNELIKAAASRRLIVAAITLPPVVLRHASVRRHIAPKQSVCRQTYQSKYHRETVLPHR